MSRSDTYAVVVISSLLLALGSPPARASTPRAGFTKLVIGHILSQPNASAPAQIITSGGGEVIADYDTLTVGYVPSAAALRLINVASLLGLEAIQRDDFDEINLPGGIIDARRGTAASLPGRALTPTYREGLPGLFLVQFDGPIKPEWTTAVTEEGTTLVQYVPYNTFIAAATPAVARWVAGLPFVQFVDVFHSFLKPQAVPRDDLELHDIYVQLARSAGVEDAVSEVSAWSKAPVQRTDKNGEVTIRGLFAGADIDPLVTHPLVFGVASVPRADFSDERAAMSVTRNVDATGHPSKPTQYREWIEELCPHCDSLKGDGFWIGFADTGLDGGVCSGADHHAELSADRVKYGTSFDANDVPCPAPEENLMSLSGVTAHGTFVVGAAAGSPETSVDPDGFYYGAGLAPSAGIFVTKINTGTLLTPVGTSASDARMTAVPPVFIQNHSYNQYENPGATCDTAVGPFDGKYSVLSRDFDRAVLDAATEGQDRAITLTVSAGNQDQQPAELASCTDRRLTLPPATAKNVIAFGGTENVRPAAEQYICKAGFPAARADSYANIETNSKRGTLTPNWFKPDLMAPSSLLVLQRSTAGNDLAYYCPAVPGSAEPSTYWIASGTSFAAPAGAAAALLASRVYAETIQPGCRTTANCDPGAARPSLLKAMLVMSARSMRGGDDRAIAPAWVPGHTYNSGDTVTGARSPTGHLYRATNSGTSAGTLIDFSAEPAWPISSNVTVNDNGITWIEAGLTNIGSLPNAQQGFGRLHLEDLLSAYPARVYINEPGPGLTSGQDWSQTYLVHDPALPVKIVLAWSDPPALQNEQGSATTILPLVNDLNLYAEIGTSCTRYLGNRMTTDPTRGEESSSAACTDIGFDTVNNVELVKFFPSVAGATEFTVHVKATTTQSAQRFSLVVYNAYTSTSGGPPPPPAAIEANADGASGVDVQWQAVSGATSYELQRKAHDEFFRTVFTGNAVSFHDTAAAKTGYLYRVRARNSNGVSRFASDFATTNALPDEVQPGSVIEAPHVNELRAAIDAARAAVDLPPSGFTETLVAGASTIKATHINELRARLEEARAAAAVYGTLPALIFTDPSLTAGATQVKAVHLVELKSAVQ